MLSFSPQRRSLQNTLNSLFQVCPSGAEGALELPLGATMKPIIVYIVSPQMFLTCLILLQHPLLSLEASCQYSQLEETHLSDIKRSDRLRTNLILRYIAETRAGAGVTESQKALT